MHMKRAEPCSAGPLAVHFLLIWGYRLHGLLAGLHLLFNSGALGRARHTQQTESLRGPLSLPILPAGAWRRDCRAAGAAAGEPGGGGRPAAAAAGGAGQGPGGQQGEQGAPGVSATWISQVVPLQRGSFSMFCSSKGGCGRITHSMQSTVCVPILPHPPLRPATVFRHASGGPHAGLGSMRVHAPSQNGSDRGHIVPACPAAS